jgi:hypothetical protein
MYSGRRKSFFAPIFLCKKISISIIFNLTDFSVKFYFLKKSLTAAKNRERIAP